VAEVELGQIHNVLRTYLNLLKNKTERPSDEEPELPADRDAVTISDEGRKKFKESQSGRSNNR